MYPNKQNIIIAALALLFSMPGLGQNVKADVAAINRAYQKMEKLSFTFEMNMFENYQTQKIYYAEVGLMQKMGRRSFQKFDQTECLNTPEYSVIIDKEEREVVYAPRKTSFSYDDPALSVDLDTLLLLCRSHEFKKTGDRLHCYDFIMAEGYPDYNRICVYFDPATYLIRKIVFYCEEDDISTGNESEKLARSRIEINYRDVDTRPALKDADFSFEKYLVRSGDKFKLRPEWKNYHLTVLSF